MKATKLNIRSIVSAIKKLDINISDYDTITEIERQINVNKFDLMLEISIFPDKTIDTSNLDYLHGTGNSCDVVESGYAEITNIDAYFDDEPFTLSKSDLDNIYKEFKKYFGNES